MEIVLFFVLFILGLIVGSYLNSWIWRYHSGKWQFPKRSICVRCSQELRWYDNIPVVSFLLLKGKCRFCKQPIPREYVWVELAGGALLAVVGVHAVWGGLSTVAIFRNIFFAFLLLVIFVYDAKYIEIPTGVVWAGSVLAVVSNIFIMRPYTSYLLLFNHNVRVIVLNLTLAALLGGGFFLAQYVVSKGRWVGGGDVRLGVMMGAILGWPKIALAIGISYILGALYAMPLLLLKEKTGESQIAFGTFLAVGTFVMMLWGQEVVNWYLGLARW